MAADKRLASVPPTSAFAPSEARSDRRSGAKAPIPPICIPMDIKFANPQRAKVERKTDFFERPFSFN